MTAALCICGYLLMGLVCVVAVLRLEPPEGEKEIEAATSVCILIFIAWAVAVPSAAVFFGIKAIVEGMAKR